LILRDYFYLPENARSLVAGLSGQFDLAFPHDKSAPFDDGSAAFFGEFEQSSNFAGLHKFIRDYLSEKPRLSKSIEQPMRIKQLSIS